MGAYAFAGIVALCRAQAGQMQACLHKPPAFAVGYLTARDLPQPCQRTAKSHH
jgi:hypothetical protein